MIFIRYALTALSAIVTVALDCTPITAPPPVRVSVTVSRPSFVTRSSIGVTVTVALTCPSGMFTLPLRLW